MLGGMDVLPGESLTSADSTESEGCNLLFSAKIGWLKIGPKSSSRMNLNSSYTREMVERTCREVWERPSIQNVFSRSSNTEEGTLWFGVLLLSGYVRALQNQQSNESRRLRTAT